MKTLTTEQRIEGFTELEGVLGEGGVGGAHLMSFLAGVAHAEKVLAEPEQDEEPVAWTCQDELNALGTDVTCYMYAEPLVGENNIPLYLHPAPRKQDDEPVARLHITETDTYPVIDVEVLNGEMLQPSMSPINVYTIQQKPFVRLSEEEVNEFVGGVDCDRNYELICAVENRLVEKNK